MKNQTSYLPHSLLVNVKIPISEEIWTCLESSQITQILHDNPRPGSHSFTSYYIPLVEIFAEIHLAIFDCRESYSAFVSNYFFKLKSLIDTHTHSIPPGVLSMLSYKSLYLNLNRPFGSDWTQISLFLTYHAAICRLNRIPLLYFLSHFKKNDPDIPDTDLLAIMNSNNDLFSSCLKDAFKSAEMIAVMCDSLVRIPSPYADFIPLYNLHFLVIEATIIFAIVSRCADFIQLSMDPNDDIVVLCKSFTGMCLKCLSTQITNFSVARVTCRFVRNVLNEMSSSKSNNCEYCNSVHILANETLERLYNMKGCTNLQDDTMLATKPDSIEDLSNYFFKNVTLL